MPKTYTPKQVIKKFHKLGFIEDRQSGSHKILYNEETGKRVVVPYHLGKIPKGTMSAILREAGITKTKFEEI